MNYPLSFVDHSLLKIKPYASGMSTTMMSINWQTLSYADNHISTSFNSPTTLTVVLSNWMILHEEGVGSPFIFLHTERGITLEDAPESTKQLCTL